MIERNRTVRNHSLAEDSVVLEVRGAVRRLRRAVDSLDFTKQEIDAAKRQARAAEIKFEDGEAGNRDVTEAQNAVLAAQNNYIRDLVEYQVARITLLRSVGILFIDEDGMWVEP